MREGTGMHGEKLYSQIDLMVIVSCMKPGECIKLTREQLVRLASGSMKSMLFDRVRDSDIAEFLRSISENWNVKVFSNFMEDSATLKKLK